MNSPLTTEYFADDGLVRYESQTFDPVVDDSSDDDEHAELEFANHVEYKVSRMLGGKADAVKEQLDVVRLDSPLVPQQLNEKSFSDFPLEVQTKVIKKLKNINAQHTKNNYVNKNAKKCACNNSFWSAKPTFIKQR